MVSEKPSTKKAFTDTKGIRNTKGYYVKIRNAIYV